MEKEIIKIDAVVPANLTDDELYAKCQQYGANAKGWLRRFAGLLPEVAKRGLYRRKGFVSIHEFANKIGGMSNFAVDRILNLHAKLQDKPALLKQFESGKEGWSKIEKVAYVATPQTDAQWAKKVELLSSHSLEACVKIEKQLCLQKAKNQTLPGGESQNNGQIAQLPISEILQPYTRFSFPISQKVDFELRLLKQRLEKMKKSCLSWDQVFETVASGELIPCPKCANKKTIIQLCPDCARKRLLAARGRAIPVAIRQFIKAKYGNKCAFPSCKKPAVILHHTKRYSLQKNHDPNFIVPLCKDHHGLAHEGMIKDENLPPEKWELRNLPEKNTLVAKIDERVQGFKKY